MKNLSRKTKIFWVNFIPALIIFVIVWIFFSTRYDSTYDITYFDFKFGYYSISFFAIIYSCYQIAMSYVRYEKLEEFRIEKKMTLEEFNKKYHDLIDKIF